jgi:hypothetical protein
VYLSFCTAYINVFEVGNMPGWWTAARQAEAFNYLVLNGGLTSHGAAGLVSRWAYVESTAAGPTAVNPYSGAFGIAQWLGSRKPPINGNINFHAQLAYVVKELNSTERKAGNVLRAARTSAEGARGASMYERAEGYNAATGIDNWTARTSNNIPTVLAIVGGGNQPPQTIVDKDPSPPRSPSVDVNGNELEVTQAINEMGAINLPALLLIGGGLVLWYILSD